MAKYLSPEEQAKMTKWLITAGCLPQDYDCWTPEQKASNLARLLSKFSLTPQQKADNLDRQRARRFMPDE